MVFSKDGMVDTEIRSSNLYLRPFKIESRAEMSSDCELCEKIFLPNFAYLFISLFIILIKIIMPLHDSLFKLLLQLFGEKNNPILSGPTLKLGKVSDNW